MDDPRKTATRVAERARNFATQADLDEFVAVLERYERGEMSPDDFRRFRLVRGIYGQRQQGAQMVRCKVPQGILLARQMERMADVAERYSRGLGHVTTRQNVQFHFVKLADCPAAMADLAAVGLTTREACGNTVRNVTACEVAGVCPGEAFDVTPYGDAITRHFLRREPFFDLPRKFKIALSGCAHDCAQGGIHDIGLIAALRDGGQSESARGFRVLAGGGLSTRPAAARLLEEFVPADEILVVCEAIAWAFWRHGNRENKSRARLKYVILTRGWDFFVSEYRKALAEERARTGGRIPIEIGAPEGAPPAPPAPAGGDAPAAWRATNLRAQKQAGFFVVVVRLTRGDVTAAQLRALARIARPHGDGSARTQAHDQNLVLRWIPESHVGAVYEELRAAELAAAGAATIVDTTACPGAETCQLAYTTSRDLALDVSARLTNVSPLGTTVGGPGRAAAVSAAGDARIKISGCPNSCGRHHIATIGWHGGVKRVGDGIVPVYQLHLGGGVDAGGARFGRQIVKVPARRVSDAVLRLLDLFGEKRAPGESADAFFRRVSDEDVRARLEDLSAIDESSATPEDFADLGQKEAVKVELGPGECAS